MAEIQVAHPLSQAIYEGVLEKPPWKTLLKYLEDYMQVPSATLVLRRPRLSLSLIHISEPTRPY